MQHPEGLGFWIEASGLQRIAHSSCHAAQSGCAHTPNNKMTQQKKSAVRASRHVAALAKQEVQLTNYIKSGAETCQSNWHQI